MDDLEQLADSYDPAGPRAALVCLECGAIIDHDQADKHDCCPAVVDWLT